MNRGGFITFLCGSAVIQLFRVMLVWVFALLPGAESHAQPEPLRGRSIILSWQDARTVEDTATGQVHDTTQTSNVKLYIGSTGRVFSDFFRQSGRGSNDVSGISDSGKQFLNWKFGEGSLVADQHFVSGARRVVISFDSGYKGCSIRVLHGKEVGSQSITYRNFNRAGQIFEVLSIKVTATSCAVRDGNVFAPPS
jgi:hypothetical protein